jgi:restriction system protein
MENMERQNRPAQPFPTQTAFFWAILRHLAQRVEGDHRERIKDAMPVLLQLSETQQAERVGNQGPRYRYRAGWGLSMLKAAGYLSTPALGIWQITDRGRELVTQHPQGFSEEIGRQITQTARRHRETEDTDDTLVEQFFQVSEQAPDEQIDAALREIHQAVAAELLEKIASEPPVFFEQLVLDLLHGMGYGASEDDLERIGGVGDGGFDGVISLDPLGFEKVYVQAKRWRGSVGRPEVQAFFGALSGRRARKGVLITTSSFTREAREFGQQITEAVVLIDGQRLASLMIEHGVGVTHYRVLRLPRVDGDYFDPS